MKDIFAEELTRIESSGLRRTLLPVTGAQGPRVTIKGKEVILLCSNDYLGLANHALIKAEAIRAIELYGFGAGASRLVSGDMEAHRALEESLRAFKGTEAVLIFNSGYHANLAVITTLVGRGDDVFSDRLNHASIVDACVLSRANVKRYASNDTDALERLLKSSRAKKKLIVTDGVFSMDGTIARMDEIAPMLNRYDAMLLVDDAHATGVLGKRGRGTLEHYIVTHPSIIQMGTLGKALGSFGAFVAGSKSLIDLLITKARPFIYTTALPPAVCMAAKKALELIDEDPGLLKRLRENTAFFKDGLSRLELDSMGSLTPIIPIRMKSADEAMRISKRLLDAGVFIQGIRPPTVPKGASRLRATITAAHSQDDLSTALSNIEEALCS